MQKRRFEIPVEQNQVQQKESCHSGPEHPLGDRKHVLKAGVVELIHLENITWKGAKENPRRFLDGGLIL